MASSVLKRMALTLPFLSSERLVIDTPTCCDRSVSDIFFSCQLDVQIDSYWHGRNPVVVIAKHS